MDLDQIDNRIETGFMFDGLSYEEVASVLSGEGVTMAQLVQLIVEANHSPEAIEGRPKVIRDGVGDEPVCECGDMQCYEPLGITWEEYDRKYKLGPPVIAPTCKGRTQEKP